MTGCPARFPAASGKCVCVQMRAAPTSISTPGGGTHCISASTVCADSFLKSTSLRVGVRGVHAGNMCACAEVRGGWQRCGCGFKPPVLNCPCSIPVPTTDAAVLAAGTPARATPRCHAATHMPTPCGCQPPALPSSSCAAAALACCCFCMEERPMRACAACLCQQQPPQNPAVLAPPPTRAHTHLWCVRTSKCSRASLSTCGDRSTQ